jgi:branched-chain amino acid transport system ATP-binding protein
MDLLRTENLTKNFGGLSAVHGVNFTLKEGELVSIIGPNGAGKSTFFKLIAGEIPSSSGKIWFRDEDITRSPQYLISHRGIATSYQIINLFPKLSTYENVRIAVQSRKTSYNFWTRADSHGDIHKSAIKILASIKLQDKGDVPAVNLSHGDQRHLEIGVALATDPVLLLLDEPTSGLNSTETVTVMELIREISRGLSVILVEHKMKVVMSVSERIAVFHEGRIIAQGSPDEIQQNETVRRVYLGVKKHDAAH